MSAFATSIRSAVLTKPTPEKALNAFETLKKLGLQSQVGSVFLSFREAGMEKNICVWNSALENLCGVKGDSYFRFDELLGEMRMLGPQPDAKSFSVAIRYHTDAGRMHMAASYIDQAKHFLKLGDGCPELKQAVAEYHRATRKLAVRGLAKSSPGAW